MAQINNQEMKRAFSDSTKTQLSEQPNNVDNRNVIPIVDITPENREYLTFGTATTLVNATSSTLFTSSALKDTYITSGVVAYINDVTSTATLITLRVTINGLTSYLVTIPTLTLTVGSGSVSFALPKPIKIDRNTAVTINSNTNVANISVSATVHGFTRDVM